MRFLVLILLAVVAVWLVKRALRRSDAKGEVEQKTPLEGELVRCAHCGVHLPRAEARMAGGALYCTDEHAQLGQR